jgi:hypothetical protein
MLEAQKSSTPYEKRQPIVLGDSAQVIYTFKIKKIFQWPTGEDDTWNKEIKLAPKKSQSMANCFHC